MSTSCTPDMRRDDSILFPRNNQPGPSGIGPSVDPPYLSRTIRTGLEVHRRSSRPARIQAMHRASTIRTAALLAVLRCGFAGEALAQTVHNPLVPRGSFFVRLHPSATTLRATYGPGTGEEHPLGTAFGPADLGTAAVPSLAPLGERVAALTRYELVPLPPSGAYRHPILGRRASGPHSTELRRPRPADAGGHRTPRPQAPRDRSQVLARGRRPRNESVGDGGRFRLLVPPRRRRFARDDAGPGQGSLPDRGCGRPRLRLRRGPRRGGRLLPLGT